MNQEVEWSRMDFTERNSWNNEFLAEIPYSGDFWTISPESGKTFNSLENYRGGADMAEIQGSLSFTSIPHSIDFGTSVFRRSAKLNDLIVDFNGDYNYRGLSISQKAKQCIEKLNLGVHKFFQYEIQKGEKGYIYYYLHLVTDQTPYVDYEKSIFYEEVGKDDPHRDIKDVPCQFREIKIDSNEHYKQVFSKYQSVGVKAKKIVLNSSVDKSLDIFSFADYSRNLFISKRFKEVIVGNKLTGFDINPTRIVHLQ